MNLLIGALCFCAGFVSGWLIQGLKLRPKIRAIDAQLKSNQDKMNAAIKLNRPK